MTEKILTLIGELSNELIKTLKVEIEKSIVSHKIMVHNGTEYVEETKPATIFIGNPVPEVDGDYIHIKLPEVVENTPEPEPDPEPEVKPIIPNHLVMKNYAFNNKFFATEDENIRDYFDNVSVKENKFWGYGIFRKINPPTADASCLIIFGNSKENAYLRLSTGIFNKNDQNKLRTYMRSSNEGGLVFKNNTTTDDYIGKDVKFEAMIRYNGPTGLLELVVNNKLESSVVVDNHKDFTFDNVTLMGGTPGASSRGSVGYVEKFTYGVLEGKNEFPTIEQIRSL